MWFATSKLLRSLRKDAGYRRYCINLKEVYSGHAGTSTGNVAQMRPAEDGKNFIVMVEEKMLKTPLDNPLLVPTSGLAYGIAAEWRTKLAEGRPITRLATAAIDRIPKMRTEVLKHLMGCLDTDIIYCRAPENTPLADKQAQVWDPLVRWVEAKMGAPSLVSYKILMGCHSKEVFQAFDKALNALSDWELVTVELLTSSTGSLVVALAILDNHLDLKDAIKVIRVDEDFQEAESLGELEKGGHTADRQLRAISLASNFIKLLRL